MTTISGTAVSAPGTITLLDFTTRVRKTLSGNNYGTDRWNKTQVQEWIRQAIIDYSIRFPIQTSTTIATVVGTYAYNLPSNFLITLSVRDATSTPPTYYAQKDHNASFWNQSEAYTIIPGHEVTAAQIWIPNATATTLTIEYEGRHDTNLSDSSVISVPEQYHDILELYILWQAGIARRDAAAVELENEDIELKEYDHLKRTAGTARISYFVAISQALKFTAGKSSIVHWSNDQLDSIY